MADPQVLPSERQESHELPESLRPWVTIAHNDPINLMTYVVFVFQKEFGFTRDQAEVMMWDMHTKGRVVVTSGARERMEYDASRLHNYGLWATVARQ